MKNFNKRVTGVDELDEARRKNLSHLEKRLLETQDVMEGPQAYRKFIVLEHSHIIFSECLPYPNVGCAPAHTLRGKN